MRLRGGAVLLGAAIASFTIMMKAQQELSPASKGLPTSVPGGRMPDPPKGTKAGPVPRMPDGKPDLGNGKGAWNPRTVVNLSGGGRQGPARSPVEKQIEIP